MKLDQLLRLKKKIARGAISINTKTVFEDGPILLK